MTAAAPTIDGSDSVRRGWMRVPIGEGAGPYLSVPFERTVLIVARTVTTTAWLLDFLHRHPESMRRAQGEVRRAPGFAHPRYWAAFQLVGAR